MEKCQVESLRKFANEIRKKTIHCIGTLGVGHFGGSMSVCEALAVLYQSIMKIDPQNPKWEERDWFVLSKGHAGPAVYATLALKGFIPMETLDTLNQPNTILPSHCDRNKTPGVDMTVGSLGQGFGNAVGLALGFKMDKKPNRVFCIVGDGECNEGSIWEGAMASAHFKLDNLTVMVDDNGLQSDGRTTDIMNMQPMDKKWEAFGWDVQTVDGHDVEQLYNALTCEAPAGKPRCIIMKTVKGKNLLGFEDVSTNHNTTITREQMLAAIAALEEVKA